MLEEAGYLWDVSLFAFRRKRRIGAETAEQYLNSPQRSLLSKNWTIMALCFLAKVINLGLHRDYEGTASIGCRGELEKILSIPI